MKQAANPSVRPLITYIWVTAIFFLSGCEKFALDREMAALCKKDGGVKVYEAIKLPGSMFDQWGDPFPGWRGRSHEQRLGADYLYSIEVVFLKLGDPLKGEGRLDKRIERIFRRSDGKLVGEAISYGRSGGDFIAYAHPSSTHCPIYQGDSEGLIKSVFGKRSE